MKINKFLFLSILGLSTFSAFSQSKYNDFSDKERENIFFDDFTVSNNYWTNDINNSLLGIKNSKCYKYSFVPGFYEIRSACKNNFITSDFNTDNAFVIDEEKDFEIETSFLITGGNIETYSSIRFGQDVNFESFFSFVFTASGNFAVMKFDKKWVDIKPYTYSNAVLKNKFNKLTIRKVKNNYYFFINETLVHTSVFEPFFGQALTFLSTENSSMKIDFIKISYLKSQKNEVADITPPKIIIETPKFNRGVKIEEPNKQILIKGKVFDNSGVYAVTINDEEVNLDSFGIFEKNVKLAYGENAIEIKATDLKNNVAIETIKIQRQETAIDDQKIIYDAISEIGKYYALLIGNNTYDDPSIVSLNEPVSDANKLYDVLSSKYNFEKQNIVKLENAKYVQIIEALDYLNDKMTQKDNLIVFFAGHGHWDEKKNFGYWLPTDAKKNSTAYWIANSRISDYMNGIKSKHTLLISDACFSGSIFKTRSAFVGALPAINKLYELPSKKAMTSGNLKEVPDKSVFMKFLLQRLTDNNEKYLSSDVLFGSFRQAVLNNSPTEPQYGVIQNAGDEGGEFIFILK